MALKGDIEPISTASNQLGICLDWCSGKAYDIGAVGLKVSKPQSN